MTKYFPNHFKQRTALTALLLAAGFFLLATGGTAAAPSEGGMIVSNTPFDKKFDFKRLSNRSLKAAGGEGREPLEVLFIKAQNFRYENDRNGDYWQSPAETEFWRNGDCEDKALWLYDRLIKNGYSDARLVVGKFRKDYSLYHVWVRYTAADGTIYVLDPTSQKRLWKRTQFSADYFIPYFSFDGKHRYMHQAPALQKPA